MQSGSVTVFKNFESVVDSADVLSLLANAFGVSAAWNSGAGTLSLLSLVLQHRRANQQDAESYGHQR